MNPRHTRITYTLVKGQPFLPDTLVQPEYIDATITSLKSNYDKSQTLQRFTSKLVSTHLYNDMIIAVWEINDYVGDVKED